VKQWGVVMWEGGGMMQILYSGGGSGAVHL